MKISKLIYLFFLGFVIISYMGCELEETIDVDDNDKVENDHPTGNMYDEEITSLATMPKDFSLITIQGNDNVNLTSRIVLDDYVPPIRSQGAYGTCTAWGCGYYCRTIMYARECNLTKADLLDDNNVFSPKYLFLGIDPVHKGDDCHGSWPGAAFKVMQEQGIATLAIVPYEDLGDCSQANTSGWNVNAANYKIESYRSIDPTDALSLKSYLSMGRPVQISCDLGLNFFGINDDEVLYDDDYTVDPADHAYHAMCLVGFDDDKGADGAFKVVNSWGDRWGDNGFCWIDYNFFTSKFCYAGYVIEGDKGGLSEAMIDQKVIDPNYRVDGKDPLTIQLLDEVDSEGTNNRDRLVTYNVFNRGNDVLPASDDWNILYYYYNAYDPENDFGVIIYDYYTDDVGSDYYGQNGDFNDIDVNMDAYGEFNWWNYVDVPSGFSVAKAVYSNDDYDYDFEFQYTVPDITGDYYFVMMADGFNSVEEQYEQNNYMFFTGADREPLKITNGIIGSSKKSINSAAHYGKLKKGEPNTYSLDEIRSLIDYQKREGILEAKLSEYKLKSAANMSGKFKGKRIVRAKLPRSM